MPTFYIRRQNELYHHGIKGQKWGVRRYQNEDGSLTPEGERRLRKALDLGNELDKHTRKANQSAAKQESYMKKKGYKDAIEFSKDGKRGNFIYVDKQGKKVDMNKLYKTDSVFKKLVDDHTVDMDNYWKAYNEFDTEYSKIKNIKLGVGSTIDNNWVNIATNYDNYKKKKVSNI